MMNIHKIFHYNAVKFNENFVSFLFLDEAVLFVEQHHP
jgi:hypothetical protein